MRILIDTSSLFEERVCLKAVHVPAQEMREVAIEDGIVYVVGIDEMLSTYPVIATCTYELTDRHEVEMLYKASTGISSSFDILTESERYAVVKPDLYKHFMGMFQCLAIWVPHLNLGKFNDEG